MKRAEFYLYSKSYNPKENAPESVRWIFDTLFLPT
jgi:hypothetical protein